MSDPFHYTSSIDSVQTSVRNSVLHALQCVTICSYQNVHKQRVEKQLQSSPISSFDAPLIFQCYQCYQALRFSPGRAPNNKSAHPALSGIRLSASRKPIPRRVLYSERIVESLGCFQHWSDRTSLVLLADLYHLPSRRVRLLSSFRHDPASIRVWKCRLRRRFDGVIVR